MAYPKKIKIAAHDYAVKRTKNNNLWGYCDTVDRAIFFNPTKGDPAERWMTLFHECVHAISQEYGLTHEDEITARIYEVAITRLFVDNPAFAREFVRNIQKMKPRSYQK